MTEAGRTFSGKTFANRTFANRTFAGKSVSNSTFASKASAGRTFASKAGAQVARASRPHPIRLRLRLAALRGRPMLAAQVAASLRELAGVLAVDASPVTGSVLVSYQPGGVPEHRLLAALEQVLKAHGLASDGPQAAQVCAAGAESPLAAVAGKVVEGVLDKLAERSTLALVAALL
jgi:hypothetical protein